MERSNILLERANRISLEAALRNWFVGQGVSVEGAARAVELLDASTIQLAMRPRPAENPPPNRTR